MNIREKVRGAGVYPALRWLRHRLGHAAMRACRAIFGIDARRVLFSSYAGGGYSDNPRAVSEALHALRPDLTIQWELLPGAPRDEVPDYVRIVPARSLAAVRAYATCRGFVLNNNRPGYMLKFPGQFYIQTWHGDRGFKRVMYDMDTDETFPDGGQMDLAVSGSRFASGVFRTAFRYGGEIMELGCPRNDALVNATPADVARARAALGVAEGTRVLLYAPTFRNGDAGGSHRAPLSLARVRERLEAATGAPWLCLSRGHELSRGVDSDAARDVSDWPDVTALLLACDMLITDYSSIGGDFMLLNRPVIYYQPDLEDYLSKDRKLYFDVDASPLMAVHDEAALMALLSGPIDAGANCRACLDYFGANETGRSARAVAEWISGTIGK